MSAKERSPTLVCVCVCVQVLTISCSARCSFHGGSHLLPFSLLPTAHSCTAVTQFGAEKKKASGI